MAEQVVRKLTPERLALVEQIQGRMREVEVDLGKLIEEEENGWTAGSPTPMSARVKPLEEIVGAVGKAVGELEVLYS